MKSVLYKFVAFWLIGHFSVNVVVASGLVYTSNITPHCTIWSLDRILGKKSKCQRRAKRLSHKEVSCRLKRTALNKNDKTITDCIYQKAGFGLGFTTISLENNGTCPRTILCKRW